LKSRFFMNAI